MTTIEPTITDVKAASAEPELCWLNLVDLVTHPDNPRASLGDLTELVRSIRSHGILEPLVVLPAGNDGKYAIVAGHRRHAAGIMAGVTDVPAVVRHMTPVEVIEAMLSENVNRSDLTIAEEVRAIERLMSLDDGLTPAKLCKRIGRSQAWVRSRMTVTILPTRWRAALHSGDLSLAAGEVAASAADLGPNHLDAICQRLAGRGWGDPGRVVANYRDDLRRTEAYERAVEKARGQHTTVHTDDDPAPDRSKRLGELFDLDVGNAHHAEPCHAVVIRRTTWGEGVDRYEVCTDPRRHAPSQVGTASGSDLASDRTSARPSGRDDSHAKRKARLARLAYATETFAKPRGGFSQTELTRLALRGLVLEAGRDALTFAATMLGHDQPRDVSVERLIDGVDTPAGLVRVAGAVALGLAETQMYWSAGSPPCREYLDLLTRSGWTPDEWTAAVLERNAARSVLTVALAADDTDDAAEDSTGTDEDDSDGDEDHDRGPDA